MNKISLRKTAEHFRDLLIKYEADSEVKLLHDAFAELIDTAIQGELNLPLNWNEIPGSWFFTEGSLRKYSDIEDAYADFKIELSDAL